MAKVRHADVFDVWGWPPSAIINSMSAREQVAFRRYVRSVATKVYRITYDTGASSTPSQPIEGER